MAKSFCRLGQGARRQAWAPAACRPPLPLRQGAGALERGNAAIRFAPQLHASGKEAGVPGCLIDLRGATSMPSVRDKDESAWRRARDVDVPPHGRIVIPWDADRDRLARADPAGTATVVVRSLASNHASGARRCRPAILVSPERREGSSGRRRSMQSRQARKRPGKARSGSAGAADRFVDSSPRGLRAASIHGAVRNEAVGAGSRTIPDCGLGRSAAIDGVGSCCCPVAVRAESRVRRCPKRASDVYSLDSRSAFLAANSSSETMPLALRSPSFSSADRTAEESAVPEDEPWWPCGADCGAGAGLL